MSWFGLGKSRTKFGKWLDANGITQREFAKKSGVSEDTITRLANDKHHRPSWRTQKRLLRVMRQYDVEISAEDFWGDGM